ncbi:MAG: 1,3-beta-galactosyl-N-acetylhexosamine phosphorylase [Oscillospiraceae bacterium]|nr:1,3-beta-galactosyl-N-acetylhexosamine phosphorylase [Oscillospiraceae bacterium]
MMKGRVTIPTDIDVIDETLEVLERWGGDALRDCDGTTFPMQLKESGAKIYATYYTTRKDNGWAKANPDEVQQCYVMTGFYAAASESALEIPLLSGISDDLMKINDFDDIKRWWEVIDRTTGDALNADSWSYCDRDGAVTILHPIPFHEYTVSFLAYLIWDPVNMYNAVVNDWQGVEPEITFDVRQPKTKAYSMERLRKFLSDNPYVDVVRFTTFFHQFTLVFDELRREKYVDWYGYSASVSPYILEQFENEAGYRFRPEFIIDQGYYNNQYRVPSKEFKDFMAFQRREVALLAKEMVDICHEFGKEAMMFLGDHFIGVEPFMEQFSSIGLDAVVGSIGNGSTTRLITDIKGVKYTEGRLLPYFFPDTFHLDGDPAQEARENWLTARRAILRSPIDRIGYGGYLKLALQFPDFMNYVAEMCDEFRALYSNVKKNGSETVPYTFARAAVLNAWGKMRAWGCHMVHHALYQKQNYSFAGVIEVLSGAPVDVCFISFDDLLENPHILDDIDVIVNVGNADTAHTGGELWRDERIITAVRSFIARGGGFIGVGEPSGHQWQGRTLQLASALGIEQENGFTLGYDKYNWDEVSHFITEGINVAEIDFGEGARNIYALEGTQVLAVRDKEVQLAANEYFNGRAVYIGGLPYSPENSDLFMRAVLWSIKQEKNLKTWSASNVHVDVHYYPQTGKYCVCNNSYENRSCTVYTDNDSFDIELAGGEIKWYER